MKPMETIVDEIDRLISDAARILEVPMKKPSTGEERANENLSRARSLMWAIEDQRDLGQMLHAAGVIARENT